MSASPQKNWQKYLIPDQAPARSDLRSYVRTEAEKMGIDPDIAERMFGQESGFKANARSPKGAFGPGQLMPGTAKYLREKYGIDTSTPEGNAKGGLHYLNEQLDEFGRDRYDLAISAYHAGPANVRKAGNRVPNTNDGLISTAGHVRKVLGSEWRPRRVASPKWLKHVTPTTAPEQIKPEQPDTITVEDFATDTVNGASAKKALPVQSPQSRTTSSGQPARAIQPDTGLRMLTSDSFNPATSDPNLLSPDVVKEQEGIAARSMLRAQGLPATELNDRASIERERKSITRDQARLKQIRGYVDKLAPGNGFQGEASRLLYENYLKPEADRLRSDFDLRVDEFNAAINRHNEQARMQPRRVPSRPQPASARVERGHLVTPNPNFGSRGTQLDLSDGSGVLSSPAPKTSAQMRDELLGQRPKLTSAQQRENLLGHAPVSLVPRTAEEYTTDLLGPRPQKRNAFEPLDRWREQQRITDVVSDDFSRTQAGAAFREGQRTGKPVSTTAGFAPVLERNDRPHPLTLAAGAFALGLTNNTVSAIGGIGNLAADMSEYLSGETPASRRLRAAIDSVERPLFGAQAAIGDETKDYGLIGRTMFNNVPSALGQILSLYMMGRVVPGMSTRIGMGGSGAISQLEQKRIEVDRNPNLTPTQKRNAKIAAFIIGSTEALGLPVETLFTKKGAGVVLKEILEESGQEKGQGVLEDIAGQWFEDKKGNIDVRNGAIEFLKTAALDPESNEAALAAAISAGIATGPGAIAMNQYLADVEGRIRGGEQIDPEEMQMYRELVGEKRKISPVSDDRAASLEALASSTPAGVPAEHHRTIVDNAKREARSIARDIVGSQPEIQITNENAPPAELAQTPTPEHPSALDAQMQALQEGRRKALLVTPGEQMPQLPKGYKTVKTKDGVFIYDPTQIKGGEILDRYHAKDYGDLLGHVAPKPEAGEPSATIAATEPETGAEIQTSVVAPEKAEAQAEALRQQFPQADVQIGGDELAAKVIEDRETVPAPSAPATGHQRGLVAQPESGTSVELAQGPATFKTAKGSSYVVHADQTTTRDKAKRPEHEDFGPQPRSEKTFYVSSEDAIKLAEFQTEGHRRVITETGDGRIGVRYVEGKDSGKFEGRTVVKAESSPRVGLTPVEVFRSGSSVHFGNEITEISQPDQASNVVDDAAHTAATSPSNDVPEPSEAQKEAGNYLKGHTRIAGLDISIENPQGSKRREEWPTLQSHYGYIRRTEGGDGEQIDVFVKPGTAQDYSGPVYVVDQVDQDGKFDEHKVMLGFDSEDSARAGYLENFTPDWKVGPIREFASPAEFKEWLKNGDTTKPAMARSKEKPRSAPLSLDAMRSARTIFNEMPPIIEYLSEGDNRFQKEVLSRIGEGAVALPPEGIQTYARFQRPDGTVVRIANPYGVREDERTTILGSSHNGVAIIEEGKTALQLASEPEERAAIKQEEGDDSFDFGENVKGEPEDGELTGQTEQRSLSADDRSVTQDTGEMDSGGTADQQSQHPQSEPDGVLSGSRALIDSIKSRLSSGDGVKNNPALTKLADVAFGGTRAQGRYNAKDSADALEVAVNEYINENAELLSKGKPSEILSKMRDLLKLLPTQSDRTAEQIELQQFSTPPTEAMVAAKALAIRPDDVVLEPSAGTGSLATWAKVEGARQVHTNEIDPRRRGLLEMQGFDTTDVDAEFIDDLLPESIQPTAVLMNPPFSATGGRVKRHDSKFGARHVEEALKRLAPGGRLVAIVSEGMAMDKSKMREWWNKILSEHNVRANISVPGEEYGKYGTTYGNQIVVIDKTGPTPGENLAEQYGSVITSAPESLEGVLNALQPVISDRPRIAKEESIRSNEVERSDSDVSRTDREQRAEKEARGRDERSRSGKQPGQAARPAESKRSDESSEPVRESESADQPQPPEQRGSLPDSSGTGEPLQRPVGDLDSVFDEEFDKLFGESPAQQSTQKPLEKSTSKSFRESGRSSVPVERTAAQAVKSAATEAVKGLDDVAKGLSQLFGGSTLRSGPAFDEETYAKAKPYFQSGLEHFKAAASDAREAISLLLKALSEKYSFTPEMLRSMKPYILRYVEEQQAQQKDLSDVVSYERSTEKREAEGENFVQYKPAKLKGGKPHPGNIVESASMAAVDPPDITYRPKLDPKLVESGELSDLQIEAITYAGQRHEQRLPDGNRAGFFVGDGTGVGKGRILAGIALDNWNQGRRRVLWLSVNNDLLPSTKRDLTALGGKDIPLAKINDFAASEKSIDFTDGVLFSAYSSLTARAKNGQERFEQIRGWLGDDGVIMFDEGHLMKNAVTSGLKKSSQRGEKGVALQEGEKSNPNWKVVYASATGATDVENMGYMVRLGLWGDGTSFPGGFPEFKAAIAGGGVGAMEMVSRDMKAMGMYTARTLSYKGVEYRESEHKLTATQRNLYDTSARAWQKVLQNIDQALSVTNADAREKMRAMMRFWGDQQRFFRQLLTAMKVPTAIKEIEKAVGDGNSVVLGLYGTGEARTVEQVKKATAAGSDLDDLDFSPKEVIINLVDRAFPTIRFTEASDPNNPDKIIKVMVKDKEGNPVHSKRALEMKAALLKELEKLSLPDNPLDQIINHFGPDKVAEITGRQKRLVRDESGRTRYVKRVEGVSMEKASVHEMEAFQEGRKRIAIISASASTGISLHADRTAKNQQRRVHVTLETGWSADIQMQTFGRTHRSNQASAPEYVLLASNVGGEKRFLSTIAKRLASLGALTRGERKATGVTSGEQEGLEKYDFLNEYGEASISRMVGAIHSGRTVEGVSSPFDSWKKMGLVKETADGIKIEDPDVERLLNRVLALEIDEQNAVFNWFTREFENTVNLAKATGIFDEGVTDIKAEAIRLVGEQPVAKEKTTGAETIHFQLEVDEKTSPVSFEKAISMMQEADSAKMVRQARSKELAVALQIASRTDPVTGAITERFRVVRVNGSEDVLDASEMREKYKAVDHSDVKAEWTEAHKSVPRVRTRDVHIIGGAIIPVWQRLQSRNDQGRVNNLKVVRVETDEGRRIVGVRIPAKSVSAVLRAIGVERSFKSPQAIFEGILDDGEQIELVGGFKLRRIRFKGSDAIELVGADRKIDEMKKLGLLHEIISYSDKLLVPTDEAKGVEALTKLVERYPAMSGGKDSANGSSVNEPDAVYESKSRRSNPNQLSFNYETRPGADRAAATALAAEALNDLSHQRRDVVSVLSERGRDAGAGVRTVALAITDNFRDSERIDLRGLNIDDARELAALAQVYRDPRYETLRYIYVKGNEIVAHEGVSSRLPASGAAFIGGKSTARAVYEIKERMRRLGADGFYLLHNHPSGQSHPSPEDLRLTKSLAAEVEGFRGHVVINSGEYSVINNENFGVTKYLLKQGKDKLLTPSIPHDLLLAELNGPEDVAYIGRQLKTPSGFVTLLYRSQNNVRAIQEMPVELFKRKEGVEYIQGRMRAFGGQSVLAYTEDPSLWEQGRRLVRLGALLDFAIGGRSAHSEGERSIMRVKHKPGIRVSDDSAPYGDYSFEDAELEERFQRAKSGVQGPTLVERLKDGLARLARIATREYEHLPRTATHADLRFRLHQIEKGKGIASDEAIRYLQGVTSGLNEEEFDLFTKKVILDDLFEEAAMQEARGVEEIRLPFGFTVESLTIEYDRFEQFVDNEPKVARAIADRRALIKQVTRDYYNAAKSIGFEPDLSREAYFHHQVLDHAEMDSRVKGTRNLKAPTGRGFLKKRAGSDLDISTNYLQAEHSVLSQMLYDTQIFNLWSFVQKQYDIKPKLKFQAKQANRDAINEMIADEQRKLPKGDQRSQPKSLIQYLRSKGGILDDGSGEVRRLKERFHNLVRKNGKYTLDGAREAAVSGDYIMPDSDEAENLNLFLEMLEYKGDDSYAFDDIERMQREEEEAHFDEQLSDEELKEKKFQKLIGRAGFTAAWLKRYQGRIAFGFKQLRDLARSGNLWTGNDNEFEQAVNNLLAHRNFAQELNDGGKLFQYLAALAANEDAEGNISARMILKAVSNRREFIRQRLGSNYKEWEDFVPDTHRMVAPREGAILYKAYTLPEKLIHEAVEQQLDELGVPVEKLRQIMAFGGRREGPVIPNEVADTLDEFGKEPDRNAISQTVRKGVRAWKVWQLISPGRVVKYNLRNISGDLDATLAGNPASLKRLPKATADLYEYLLRGNAPSKELEGWLQRGGLYNLFQVAENLGDINGLKVFRNLQTDKEGHLEKMNLWKQYWRTARLSTDFREAILRYANYLEYLSQVESNNGKPKNYGASIRAEVNALKDNADKAYKLSNDLLGAYDEVTVLGQNLRETIFPFWSWQEVNAKRYKRLFQNALQDDRLAAAVGRKLVSSVVRSPITALRVGRFALKVGMLSAILAAFNHLVFPDDEEELPEEVKKRPHLTMGRDRDGKIVHFTRLGSISDLLEWVGLDMDGQFARDVLSGKKTLKQAALDMAKAPPQKLWQSLGPAKTIFEVATKRATYPDVFKPRSVRDRWEHAFDSIGLGDVYRHIAGRPTRGVGSSLLNTIIYRADPDEAAYNEIRGLKGEFMEKLGKSAPDVSYDSPKSNALYYLKQAMRYEDKEAMKKYLLEYLTNGGTVKGLRQSLKALDPLNGLNDAQRKAFVISLTPDDRAKLGRAYGFYEKVLSPDSKPDDTSERQTLPKRSQPSSVVKSPPGVAMPSSVIRPSSQFFRVPSGL